jgi:HEAT repeat protein
VTVPGLDEIRLQLDRDELDYPALAAELGPDSLPNLDALVAEDEPRIASKAAYLAALIAGPTSDRVVALAARSRHDVVRVAAAAAIAELPADQATGIAEDLLSDPDIGVRARAAKSAVALDDPALLERVRTMADEDSEPTVRELAADLANLSPGS